MESDFNFGRFGERLKEVRTKRKKTLSDVSEETKISVPTISRVERGEAKGIESKNLFVLSKWAALNLELFQNKQKTGGSNDVSTLEVVELHLRADKNLDSKTAELLVKMFRAAYEQAASER